MRAHSRRGLLLVTGLCRTDVVKPASKISLMKTRLKFHAGTFVISIQFADIFLKIPIRNLPSSYFHDPSLFK